jgi:DNA mismatch repair protein MSH4
MQKRIDEVVEHEPCHVHARSSFITRTQQVFAVKKGVNSFLDLARATFCATTETIHSLAEGYRSELNLPGLKTTYSMRKGFTLSFPQAEVEGRLPSLFIHVTYQGKNVLCTTQELVGLNLRLTDASNEIYALSESSLEELYELLNAHSHLLSLLCDGIALVDVLWAFTHMVSTAQTEFVKPEFSEPGAPLALDGARHPLLEQRTANVVANQTFLSEVGTMCIITGAMPLLSTAHLVREGFPK